VRTKNLWIKEEYLDQILRGDKDVEVRVGYSNISRLREGDVLLLNGEHAYQITRVGRYASHDMLVQQEDIERIAPGMSRDEVLAELKRIYPPEKEALGVVALEVRPANRAD
jgi:ASC-1-like (ASCH) protein